MSLNVSPGHRAEPPPPAEQEFETLRCAGKFVRCAQKKIRIARK
jgi:hypothetical protein